jgi:hypothetical protein
VGGYVWVVILGLADGVPYCGIVAGNCAYEFNDKELAVVVPPRYDDAGAAIF